MIKQLIDADFEALPCREEVLDILAELINVMFYGEKEGQLERIEKKLSKEIAKVHPNATEETKSFINKLPAVQELIRGDAAAALNGDPACSGIEEVIITYPGFYAIAVQRIAHELYLRKINIIPRIMTERAHKKTGIDIHPGVTIGKNFFIDHGTGVVIGETAVIGNNVRIYQGVTLGALSVRKGQQLRGTKRHPNVEDGVIIYANASILGPVTVGEGSTIGGNAFVLDDVKPYSKITYISQ